MSESTITVTAASPVRLDAFLRAALPTFSRRLAKLAIAEGAVRVNGRPAQKGMLVAAGDRVTIPATTALVAEADLPVPVLYEDAWLIVADKPGGMRGHALDPRQRGTVAGFLLGRYPETAGLGDGLSSGLVHRLDQGTSGVLVAARTKAAFEALRGAFRRRAVRKRYLAIVEGVPPATADVDTSLAHDPADRRRMIATRPGLRSWPAATRIERLSTGPGGSLVAATMSTGVTHQIRVHLALLGHPVVGDALYGKPTALLAAGRHALHAARITIPHPDGTRLLELASELPNDLGAVLDGSG